MYICIHTYIYIYTASATGVVTDIATGDFLVRSALTVAGNYTVRAPNLSHKMHLLISFRKSTQPQIFNSFFTVINSNFKVTV